MGRSSTLSQAVADALRQSLRDGIYLPGDRLAELTISQEMNVSQNTVRDALNILESEGWVVRRPRHGVIVRAFTSDETEELYALRGVLEDAVLMWTLPEMTDSEKNVLSRIVGEARIQAGMNNARGATLSIYAFHEALLSIADRPLTAQTLNPLLNQCRLLSNLRANYEHDNRDKQAERITQYGELVTEIRYDNYDASRDILQRILHAECQTLLPVLDLIM